jgi:hypothetical protein
VKSVDNQCHFVMADYRGERSPVVLGADLTRLLLLPPRETNSSDEKTPMLISRRTVELQIIVNQLLELSDQRKSWNSIIMHRAPTECADVQATVVNKVHNSDDNPRMNHLAGTSTKLDSSSTAWISILLARECYLGSGLRRRLSPPNTRPRCGVQAPWRDAE